MKSDYEFIRVLALGNIKKKLHSYFNEVVKFSAVDLRLMAGIFKKKVVLKSRQKRTSFNKLFKIDSA